MAQGKTVFHSALQTPTTLKVKSGVIPSKFPGKPPYLIIEVNGEDKFYPQENAQCGVDLAAWNGHECRVTALGRGESASFQIEQADQIPGAEVPPSQQQHPPPQRPAPAAARPAPVKPAWGARPAAAPAAAPSPAPIRQQLDPQTALANAQQFIGTHRVLLELCQQAATYNAFNYALANKEAIAKGELPVLDGHAIQAAASTLFIAARQAGHGNDLPDQLPVAQ